MGSRVVCSIGNTKENNCSEYFQGMQPRSLLFVKTPTDIVSPLVSPSIRFSFDELEWKPQKSSLKKPGIKMQSTPSKLKKVRFNQVFYPVRQLYREGYFISSNNEITR